MSQQRGITDHVRVYKMTAYPKQVTLLSGAQVTLRPMTPEDENELLQFFLLVPEEDRRYLKEDVTSPEVIARWSRQLDYNRALPLLAIVDGRIVGDATLHRRRAIAFSHVGAVRVVVAPVYRTQGLGTVLLTELITIAADAGLEKLVFELVEREQDQAIEAAEHLGFVRIATLEGHAKDPTGMPQNVVILELPLADWNAWRQF